MEIWTPVILRHDHNSCWTVGWTAGHIVTVCDVLRGLHRPHLHLHQTNRTPVRLSLDISSCWRWLSYSNCTQTQSVSEQTNNQQQQRRQLSSAGRHLYCGVWFWFHLVSAINLHNGLYIRHNRERHGRPSVP